MLEKVMRVAAQAHQGQTRKASSLPYFLHPASVALVLVRAGFCSDTILAAAILHDTLEDTCVDEDFLRAEFPTDVCDIVEGASEQKLDEAGNKLPWSTRKREHIDRVKRAGFETRAVVLGDKLHNLFSMVSDLDRGESLWNRFSASKPDVLEYHDDIVTAAELGRQDVSPDDRITKLAAECRKLIDRLRQDPSV